MFPVSKRKGSPAKFARRCLSLAGKRTSLLRWLSVLLLCAVLLPLAGRSVAHADFVGPTTLTIDGTFTDWGTVGSPTSGVYVQQDANNTGEDDGTGFDGKAADINYFWQAISTQNGTSPASPSNLIQNAYYRFDTLYNKALTGQSYWIQLNLGTATVGSADHVLQMYVSGATPAVYIALYSYNTPYPSMRAFTTGTITAQVANVSGYGVLDTNATGATAKYDGTNYGFEVKIPIGWFGSTYGGAVTADGTGASAIRGAIFTSTGSMGGVGTVKDTVNNASNKTLIGQASATTGETSFVTTAISKIVFTTSTQTLTAGTVSSMMTIQTQDATGAAQNVSANTTVNLTSSSGSGTFYSDSGGTSQITYVTITNGGNSASFYYKDTTAGTPTITAAENPSQSWTDATQQETINAAALDHFTFNTISNQTAGTAFSITITAKDAYNNTVTSYSSTNTLSDTTGSISPTSTGSFTSGVWTGSVTITTAQNNITISTTGSSKSGTSNTFNVTAAAGADISNTPTSYAFGVVTEGSTPGTGLTYFTVTNVGSVSVNITISGTDMTGGATWTLSDTATPGADTVGLKAGLEGGSYSIVVKKNTPYNTLASALAAGNSQRWGLQLLAPTTFSDGGSKSGTITLTATQS